MLRPAQNITPNRKNNHANWRERGFITLTEATKLCTYSQEYLSFLARHGELRAEKFGRNWYTKPAWLKTYVENHAEDLVINGKGKLLTEEMVVERVRIFEEVNNEVKNLMALLQEKIMLVGKNGLIATLAVLILVGTVLAQPQTTKDFAVMEIKLARAGIGEVKNILWNEGAIQFCAQMKEVALSAKEDFVGTKNFGEIREIRGKKFVAGAETSEVWKNFISRFIRVKNLNISMAKNFENAEKEIYLVHRDWQKIGAEVSTWFGEKNFMVHMNDLIPTLSFVRRGGAQIIGSATKIIGHTGENINNLAINLGGKIGAWLSSFQKTEWDTQLLAQLAKRKNETTIVYQGDQGTADVTEIKNITEITEVSEVPGMTGATGARGEKGEKGERGDLGLTGPQGPAGPAGVCSGTCSGGSGSVTNVYNVGVPGATAHDGAGSSFAAKYIGAGELSVSGNTSLNGTLTVGGGASFSSGVSIAGALSSGSFSASSGSFGGGVTIATLNATTTNIDTLQVFGNATTTGVQSIVGQLKVATSTLDENYKFGVGGPVYIAGNFYHEGNATTTGAYKIGGDLTVGGTSIFIGGSSFNSITTTDSANFGGRVSVATSTPFENFGLVVATSTRIQSDTPEIPKFVVGSSTATSLFVNSAGNVGIGITNGTSTLSVLGSLYAQGNATSTGSMYIGNDLTVANSTVLGTSMANTLTVNNYVNSSLIPQSNSFNLGSTANRWNTIYGDTINANNIVANATEIGGTKATDFTINSDNATVDTEDMSVTFERGTPVTNAVFGWDASIHQFTMNFPLLIEGTDTGGSASSTLTVKAGANQGTANLFQLQNSSGNNLIQAGPQGHFAIGASYQDTYGFTVATTTYFSVGANFNSITTTDSAYIGGRSSLMGNVGIGTTNPLANLVVFGGNVGVGITNPTALFEIATTTTHWAAGVRPLMRVATKTTEALYVGADGNVGIGTTIPYYKLQVNGSAEFLTGNLDMSTGYGVHSNFDSKGLNFGYDGVSASFSNFTNKVSLGYTTGPGTATLAVSGNVGIGTTNPLANLVVFGGNVGIGTTTPLALLEVSTSTVDWAAGVRPLMRVATKTTEAFYIAASGNVGVGTTNPAYKLDVTGTGGFTGVLTALSLNIGDGSNQIKRTNYITEIYGYSGIKLQTYDGAISDKVTITTAGNVGIATTNPTAFLEIATTTNHWAAGTRPLMRVATKTTEAFYIAATGNVGIGTTVPTSKLQVVGSDETDATVIARFSSPGVADRIVIRNSGAASGQFYSSGSLDFNGVGNLRYLIGGNVQMQLNATGLAIGHNAPASRLAVNGGAIIGSSSSFYYGVAPTGGLAVEGNVGIGTTNPLANLVVFGGNVGIGITNPTALFEVATTTVDWASGVRPLMRVATKTTEALYVGADGNVGIGTTAPTHKLDIKAATATGLDISATTANSYSRLSFGTNANVIYGFNSSYSSAGRFVVSSLLVDANAQLGLAANNSYPIAFYLNNSEKMRIDSVGNVGIGTTAPTSTLQTIGTFSVATTSALGFNKREVFNVNGTNSFATTTVKDYFQVVQANETASLFVDKGGNVGIGTTNPAANLDIVGTLRVNSGYITSDTYGLLAVNGYVKSKYNYSTNYYSSGADLPIVFKDYTTNAELVRITSTGNVGIGTTNPLANLVVFGGNVGIGITNPTALFEIATTTTDWAAGVRPLMRVATKTTEALYVAASGNVGVGNTIPAQKLDVTGNIINSGGDYITSASAVRLMTSTTNNVFRGIRDTSAWSDAVDTQWFQVGNSADNIIFTALYGTVAGRMGFITSGFQVNNSVNRDAPVGLFDISNGNTKLFNVLSTGNVGIGTTNPLANLVVFGGNVGVGITNPTALFEVATTTIDWAAGVRPLMRVATKTTEALYVAASGNVGIGTTVPGRKFTIAGANANALTGPNIRLITSADAYPQWETFAYAHDNVSFIFDAYYDGANWKSSDTGSNFALYKFEDKIGLWYDSDVVAGNTLVWNTDGIILDKVGNVAIGYATPGTGKLSINGNVGIGTTAPGQELEISGAPAANVFIGTKVTDTGTGGTNLKVGIIKNSSATVGYGGIWIGQTTPTTDNFAFLSAGYTIFNSPATQMSFRVAGTNRMVLFTSGGLSLGSTYYLKDPGLNNMIIEGNVGIGTTNPLAKLHASSTTEQLRLTNGAVNSANLTAFNVLSAGDLIIDPQGTATTTFVWSNLKVEGNATTTGSLVVGNPTGGGMGAGTINAEHTLYVNGADYAEYFLASDVGLQPGEAVCIDVTNEKAVKRCLRGADPDIIGIVSTNPALVGNNQKFDGETVIVGLIGQVPALASDENGSIRPGDSLTSASSTPGYLMKAMAGDSTVGVALTGLQIGTGDINVLISRRNKSLTVEQVEEEVTKRVADMKIEDEVNLMISSAMEDLGVDGQIQELTNRILDGESKLEVLSAKLSSAEEKFAIGEGGEIRILADAVVEGNLTVVKNITASTTVAKTGSFQELVLGEADLMNNEQATITTTTTIDNLQQTTNNRQVRITVIDGADNGEVRVKISGGAEFGGTVTVKDLIITGNVVVLERATFKKDVVMEANLELTGALIHNFKQATNTALSVGDAVYVSAAGAVERAYADNPSFKPALGMVVKIKENGEAGVAIGGTVGGFQNLVPGARYYLSELSYYYEQRTTPATTTEPLALAALTPVAPERDGSAVQPVAVAISESEIIVMPSLEFHFVGGETAATSDFGNTLKDNLFLDNLDSIERSEERTENGEELMTTSEQELENSEPATLAGEEPATTSEEGIEKSEPTAAASAEPTTTNEPTALEVEATALVGDEPEISIPVLSPEPEVVVEVIPPTE